MTINEFFNTCYFHDSLMESINFDGTKLILDIDFCWWMQDNYQPDDKELRLMKVIFPNITCFNFDCNNKEINSDTILDFSVIEEEANSDNPLVRIVLQGDILRDINDIKIITFRTIGVELYLE